MLATLLTSPEVLTLLGWLCATALIGLVAGCDCCATCDIASDDFASDDFATNWTASTGSFTISGGVMTTSSNPAVAIHNTAHPDSRITMKVSADISHGTSGSSCRLYAAWTDSTHYIVAEFTFGTNTIAIFQNTGGGEGLLSSASATLNTGSTYSVWICIDKLKLVSAGIGGTSYVTASAFGTFGYKGGIGAKGTGTAIFDNFTLEKSHYLGVTDGCTHCLVGQGFDCYSKCSDHILPDQYQVTFSGITPMGSGLCTCSACSNMNATFILDRVGDRIYGYWLTSEQVCPESLGLSDPGTYAFGCISLSVCINTILYSTLNLTGASGTNADCVASDGASGAFFFHHNSGSFACASIAGVDFPRDFSRFGACSGTDKVCGDTGSATVTAL